MISAAQRPSTSPLHGARLRRLGLLAVVGLAALVVGVPGVAGSESGRHRLVGDRLTARVTGGPTAGAWRIRIVAPDGAERIDFVLSHGDYEWHAVVRTYRHTGSGWRATGRTRINGFYDRLGTASGEAAGVRWSSTDFRLPADGDGRFAITVELTRNGEYRVFGALRLAEEAFSYGPWQRVSEASVSH